MQRLPVDGVELAYEEAGAGPETVVLSHSYLVDHRQFRGQIDALAETHRVIAFDHRDHGESTPATGPYTMADLVTDAESLLDRLDATPCHFVGLSTGGFVGMRLALRDSSRLSSLTLMDTSAEADTGLQAFRNRGMMTALRIVGPKPLMPIAMRLMFGPRYLADPDRKDEAAAWRQRMAANDAKALIRFGRAIFSRDSVLEQLRSLRLPTHVIVGRDDRALPVARSNAIADAVPGAELSVIDGAGHLCTIEQPDAVNDVLVRFIRSHSTV